MNNDVKRYKIYGLFSSSTNELRYIGRTINKIEYRVLNHLKNYSNESTYKANWIKSEILAGHTPYIKIIQSFDNLSALEFDKLEQYWIKYFRDQGCKLTNLSAGGGGILNPTLETRYKMSRSHIGKKLSEEQKKKISIGNMGRKVSIETRIKLSKSKIGNKVNIGRVVTQETKDKISKSNKGKIKYSLIGIPRPPHVIEAVRLAHKGLKHSEEWNLNRSRSIGGRPIIDQFGNKYLAIFDAAKKLKLHQSLIGKVLHGERKSTGGYIFKYVEE